MGLDTMSRITVICDEKEQCYRIWVGEKEHLSGFRYKGDKERYKAWLDCLRAARALEIEIEEKNEDL